MHCHENSPGISLLPQQHGKSDRVRAQSIFDPSNLHFSLIVNQLANWNEKHYFSQF